jgi:hypothetical protein
MPAAEKPDTFDIEAFARRQVELVEPGEPVFVLTGRDRQAPDLIRRWCDGRRHWRAAVQQVLPILYLYSPSVLFGMSAKVHGFVPVADGMMRLTGVTLAE